MLMTPNAKPKSARVRHCLRGNGQQGETATCPRPTQPRSDLLPPCDCLYRGSTFHAFKHRWLFSTMKAGILTRNEAGLSHVDVQDQVTAVSGDRLGQLPPFPIGHVVRETSMAVSDQLFPWQG